MNRVAWNVKKKWFSEKLRKNVDLENFRSDSFSIHTSTSRIESSRFRARVAKDRPAFRDRITRGSLESKIGYRGVGADFEKPKKYFRLLMNRVAWNVDENGFRKTSKNFWLRIFSVRVILDTYLLYRELQLPSSCCKGKACLPRSHYQGSPRVPPPPQVSTQPI